MGWETKKGDIRKYAIKPEAGEDGVSYGLSPVWADGSGVGGVASKTGGYTQPDQYLSPNKKFKKGYIGAGPNRSVTSK